MIFMILRLFAMLFALILTIGSAMQEAKYDEENSTKEETIKPSPEK